MQNRLIKAVGKKGRWICLYSLWSRNANAPIKYFLCLKTEKTKFKSEHHNVQVCVRGEGERERHGDAAQRDPGL